MTCKIGFQKHRNSLPQQDKTYSKYIMSEIIRSIIKKHIITLHFLTKRKQKVDLAERLSSIDSDD